MAIGAIREREIPYYYLSNLLYKKDVKNYRDYIGRKNMYRVINNLFDPFYTPKLNDKLTFSKIMRENNLSSPLTKRLSLNGEIVVDDESTNLSTSEFANLLEEIIKRSSSKSIFIKPINLSGGKYCFKLNSESLTNVEQINDLYSLLKKEDFIYQETLEQHPDINKIYPHSINTVRVHSHFDKKNNRVEIVSALMRFGKDGMTVDNGSSGGLYVNIDLDNWSLQGRGQTYFSNGGKYFDNHPDSDVHFDNYKLPFKNELYEVIDKGARLFDNEMIGWDIAVTPEGPSFIEGNSSPHLVMAQVACGGFRSHPQFKKIFSEYI